MLLADSNYWLALALSKHSFHADARRWLARKGGGEKIAYCRLTQLTFLRLITTSAVTLPYDSAPMTNEKAWSMYEAFAGHKRITFIDEPPKIVTHWARLAATVTASPKLWMDSYLAAFAIAGGYRLLTADAAFRQFNELKLVMLSS
jgi:toxin-antitoxin system PIN domain toxin